MFRSTTIIRELVLNLAEVIFMLKHSVKLRRYMLFGDVAACHRTACVLCAVLCTAHNNAPTMLPAGQQHRGYIIPQVVTHSLVLLKMGKIIARNMLI